MSCVHGGVSLELRCTICAAKTLAYLRAENKRLRAVRDAAEASEIAENHSYYCGVTMLDGPCNCGHEALRAALDAAKEVT